MDEFLPEGDNPRLLSIRQKYRMGLKSEEEDKFAPLLLGEHCNVYNFLSERSVRLVFYFPKPKFL